ncbi:hypothetical protein B7R54_13445 [Subtercola boreus]|uniref:Uncharacterized protein n=1 Tax=Subtercola boreus TaxID=120213 RepID=A0A3E0VKY7_9MICO|nr:hypothetical protein [Subtercola boreus]RFA10103.1 hypothetical protein B7R54_13445 [Subtercola boreus]
MSDNVSAELISVLALGDHDHGATTVATALRVRLAERSIANVVLVDTWAYDDVVRGLAAGEYRAEIALLVVSAAIGTTPRSALLLRMLRARRFRRVVVAVTFTDVVDDDRLVGITLHEIRVDTARYGFPDAPLVIVKHARTGAGGVDSARSLDRCIAALSTVVNPSGESGGPG